MSEAFLTNPPWIQLAETNRQGWPLIELQGELVFRLGNGSGSITVTVPKGFRSDLCSAPRFFWRIFPPLGQYSRAAIMHDFLYTRKDIGSRFLADSLFREAMKELGVPAWKCVVMYYAVRVFGWAFYGSTKGTK